MKNFVFFDFSLGCTLSKICNKKYKPISVDCSSSYYSHLVLRSVGCGGNKSENKYCFLIPNTLHTDVSIPRLVFVFTNILLSQNHKIIGRVPRIKNTSIKRARLRRHQYYRDILTIYRHHIIVDVKKQYNSYLLIQYGKDRQCNMILTNFLNYY